MPRSTQPSKAPEIINPFEGIDVAVEHNGSRIVLPAYPVDMDLPVAAQWLMKKHEEAEQEVTINEEIDAFPLEGAVAFQRAMQRTFGWVSAVPTPGFFGPTPPKTIEVKTSHNTSMAVTWGRFNLPNIDGYLQCSGTDSSTGPKFVIGGKVRRKDHEVIRTLANLTRQIAKLESIYRNKALQLEVDSDGDVNWLSGLTFHDYTKVEPNDLIFSLATQRQIDMSLFTPIEKSEQCRQHKIPLKRAILLEGKYGTGKTLTSAVTALKAIENNWTFLSISRVSGLDQALLFARRFQPCVIFAEDVDRVVAGEERTDEIDDVLNTIDGIGSKGTEIMVVLTTNAIETINRAMLRPGRLDAIISVTPPDEQAVVRLVRLYGRSMLAANDPLTKTAHVLAGQIPAMIRETVERAKLYAIQRSDGDLDSDIKVTDDDLHASAVGLEQHSKLLETPVESKKEDTLSSIIAAAVGDAINRIATVTDATHNNVRSMSINMRNVRDTVQAAANGSKALEAMAERVERVDSTTRKILDHVAE